MHVIIVVERNGCFYKGLVEKCHALIVGVRVGQCKEHFRHITVPGTIGEGVPEPPVDFIIIGVQKGGTTAAARNLNKHPEICIHHKEPHFFDKEHKWKLGLPYYHKRVNRTARIAGEKTPSLICMPHTHYRMQQVVPRARLILLLRDPVTRAFSQWQMQRRQIWNMRHKGKYIFPSFRNMMTMIHRGHYYDQIQHLLTLFPREQLHIAISEWVLQDMQNEYNEMARFLGAETFPPGVDFRTHFVNKDPEETLGEQEREMLTEWYRPHNEKLFEFLGYDIPEWSRPHSSVE